MFVLICRSKGDREHRKKEKSAICLFKKLLSIFFSTENAIQAFGNGTDVNVWQPFLPVQTTTALTTTGYRSKTYDSENANNEIPTNNDLPACANIKVRNNCNWTVI